MSKRIYLYAFLIMLLLISCSEPIANDLQDRTIETQLLGIKESAQLNPSRYNNDLKIQLLKKTDDEKSINKFQLAKQYILNGNTDKGIEILLDIQSSGVFEGFSEKRKYQFKKLLAVSFLRYGEQVNCLSNHSSESCVFPLKGKGVYTYTNFTQEALNLYRGRYLTSYLLYLVST